MVKTPSFEKLHMAEGNIGTGDEDAKRLPYLSMPKKAGVRRSCGKNCRIKLNDLVQSSFSPDEEELIIKLHATIGSRWTIIAQQLPRRTDDEVKNLWNKKLKKKLTAMGIDPITHRPFSQILADYGNIGAFPSKARRNEFKLKSELPFSPPETSSNLNNHFNTTRIPTFSQTNSDWAHVTPAESDYSLELLAQLQAITMVTGPSARVPIECISSSASSSPPESSPGDTNKAIINGSSSSFSWSDFLLEDAFLPTNNGDKEEGNYGAKFSIKKEEDHQQREAQNQSTMKSFEDSSVSDGSFVEAMLERENEMLSDFQGLLEEPFYY